MSTGVHRDVPWVGEAKEEGPCLQCSCALQRYCAPGSLLD